MPGKYSTALIEKWINQLQINCGISTILKRGDHNMGRTGGHYASGNTPDIARNLLYNLTYSGSKSTLENKTELG